MIKETRCILKEGLSSAEWEFVYVTHIENVAPHVTRATVIDVAVPEEVGVAVVECARPCVIRLQTQPIRETLIAADLQPRVFRCCVVGVSVERLRPAELLEVEPAQVGIGRLLT